jgi:hypothetical protein
VGTHPKADFPFQVADNGFARQVMNERLAFGVWSEVERLIRLRFEPDLGDVASRLADAQAKGKVQEADEIAIRAAAFGKGSGSYLEQRFGIPNHFVPLVFRSAPALSGRAPTLPPYEKIKRGEMIPVSFD